jgi:hypothetical protein
MLTPFVVFACCFGRHFRDGPKDQTSDAQLRIGESRDSQVRNCAHHSSMLRIAPE